MTVNRGLWVPIDTGNVGTTELEARLADAGLFESDNGTDARSGILRTSTTFPVVVLGTAGMAYSILPATFAKTRSAGDGVYRFSTTGATTVPTLAAPVANSRIDVIWVRQNDQSKGDPDNKAIAGVANGTAAASPAAPEIPVGAMELARATITSTTTRTDAASLVQTFRHTALRGTPVAVRNTTERAEITTPRAGQKVQRLDLGPAVTETWDGTSWVGDGPKIEIGQGAKQPIFKGYEVAVTLDAFSVGQITFPAAFPTALATVNLTRNHSTAGPMDFNILSGTGHPTTGKAGVKFVGVSNPSAANQTVYIYIQAWGY